MRNTIIASITSAATVVAAAVVPLAIGSSTPESAGETAPESRHAASSGYHAVIREPSLGLADHTVYRPADLKGNASGLPVLVWSNGGCRPSNVLFMNMLMSVAARGYTVVAHGAPEAPSNIQTGSANPERVERVLDWLQSSNARRQLGAKAPRAPIAVAGESCGGIEALVAGADPRVDSVASLNSGFFPSPAGGGTPFGGFGRERLADLHTPVMFLDGGPCDVAYNNTRQNYALVNEVPAVLVENPQGGHATSYYGMRLGKGTNGCDPLPDDGTMTILEETVDVMVAWLDYTLKGYRSARNVFVDPCTICQVPQWSVSTKNGF